MRKILIMLSLLLASTCCAEDYGDAPPNKATKIKVVDFNSYFDSASAPTVQSALEQISASYPTVSVAPYLKLDTSNDPITGHLQSGTDGIGTGLTWYSSTVGTYWDLSAAGTWNLYNQGDFTWDGYDNIDLVGATITSDSNIIMTATASCATVHATTELDIGTGNTAVIFKDGGNNLVLRDTVTGYKTLAQLAETGAVDHSSLFNLGMSVSGHTWDADVDFNTRNLLTTGTLGAGAITGTTLLATAAGGLTLGTDAATNIAGYIKMWSAGATNYYTTFTAGTQTGNCAYTLPLAIGAAGTVLTDAAGNGVLSWAAGGSQTPWTANVDADGYDLLDIGVFDFRTPTTGWAVSNVSSDKVFDADSTSLNEIADVLGQLITDLKVLGILEA